MRRIDIIIVALLITGMFLLPLATERKIADECRKIGAFEANGAVFKCREKPAK